MNNLNTLIELYTLAKKDDAGELILAIKELRLNNVPNLIINKVLMLAHSSSQIENVQLTIKGLLITA